jgi:hypothetical protein
MKITTAALAAILAALPSHVLAQCAPAAELNPCELALFETATELQKRRKTCGVMLNACQQKLETRTSTVVKTLVKPCPPMPAPGNDWSVLVTTGAASLAIGLLLGLIGS